MSSATSVTVCRWPLTVSSSDFIPVLSVRKVDVVFVGCRRFLDRSVDRDLDGRE
ncbi:MAG: hypothetical protein RL287_588, partial [Actinomycetota bacterium]